MKLTVKRNTLSSLLCIHLSLNHSHLAFSACFKVLLQEKHFCPPSFLPILLHLLHILFFPDTMLPLPLYLYSNVQSLTSTKWPKQTLHPDILVKCHVRIVLPRCDEGDRGQSVHSHVVYTPAPLSGHLLTPVIPSYVYCHCHHAQPITTASLPHSCCFQEMGLCSSNFQVMLRYRKCTNLVLSPPQNTALETTQII